MIARMIQFLVARSHKEYSAGTRTMATVLGAALFIAGFPALVFTAGRFFWGAPVLPSAVVPFASSISFISGIPWTAWAVFWQLTRGKGTPVPVVPTKHLLQSGPYRYVRNPMMLGFFLYLLGWVFFFNEAAGLAFWAVLAALLVAEIRGIEERELEERFGEPYREYKKETPFIFPRFPRK